MTSPFDRRVVLAGAACQLPDASSPDTFFENVLAKRQSFRAIPPNRLDLGDYLASKIGEADSITPVLAGLISNWSFDTHKYRIPKDTFASTDLTHWLALDVAAQAVSACGGIEKFRRGRTGVIVANTLTGEFSRTSQLRLRWPWLDRQLASVLDVQAMAPANARLIREAFRERVYGAFPAPDEDMLAGGLANTIAGRIANFFDLHAGAWSVDGACASSLVAVANAAEQVAGGRVDAMIVVGVDLSLDPFELVGFSRNGALAADRMRVFDARANGFWPGEGAVAIVIGERGWAEEVGIDWQVEVAGWGLSSDGSGGLTRPDEQGQIRALSEAYGRFGLDPSDLGYLEAHGTGTAVGDPTEVRALATFLATSTAIHSVPVGSAKANIGHTKAASGLTGFIRAAEALKNGIVPPHTGCVVAHPVFHQTGDRVRVPENAEAWRRRGRRTTGISSFGFGGINAHVVLRSDLAAASPLPPTLSWSEDEIFAFQAENDNLLRVQLDQMRALATTASVSEVRELAARLALAPGKGQVRLAFVAGKPDELCSKLEAAVEALNGFERSGIFLGNGPAKLRIGFVFPGQAAPCRSLAGAWAQRFGCLRVPWEVEGNPGHTANAQPLIVNASLAGLDLLERLGIRGKAGLGHSLGEIVALHWAGAFTDHALLDLTKMRGEVMGEMSPGGMLLLACDEKTAEDLARCSGATIACFNGPREIVVAGPPAAIDEVDKRAVARKISTTRLEVSHAFHSAMMTPAEGAVRIALKNALPCAILRPVYSTVTGEVLERDTNLVGLLSNQLTSPVRFSEAAIRFAQACDIAIEVGPGSSISRLLEGMGLEAYPLDVFSQTCKPVFEALARLHAAGAIMDIAALYHDVRSTSLGERQPNFLASPCGTPPTDIQFEQVGSPAALVPIIDLTAPGGSCLEQLISLVSHKTGLPTELIEPHHRFLDDLHLSSLAVNRILSQIATLRGIRLPGHRTAFSNAALDDVARELEHAENAPHISLSEPVAGAGHWVRRFRPVQRAVGQNISEMIDWHEIALHDPMPDGCQSLAVRVEGWNAERDAVALVRVAQEASGTCRHLALLHHGAPLEGFARSLNAEHLFDSVRAIDVRAYPGRLGYLPTGLSVLTLDSSGEATCPDLVLEDGSLVPGIEPKVIAITGGARGIGAEVAIALASKTAAAVILIGRSPLESADVARTMERGRQLGLKIGYAEASVEHADLLKAALGPWIERFGPVTHLIHAAGINEPANILQLDEQRVYQTMAPKCDGLINAIAACGSGLERIVAFGSMIGRLGLEGEAHYALANAEQSRLLAKFAESNPEVQTLSIEWSVWAGAGMGERLGVIERLQADGIEAIPLGQAIHQAIELVLSDATGSIVVTSRFGYDVGRAAFAPMRFLDRPLLYTPGVELVVETTLNQGRDPYLESHLVDGVAVMPGVLLLEAMGQVAEQLGGHDLLGTIDDIAFTASVSVDAQGTPIRVAALRDPNGFVVAEVRSGEDGFAVPVARATFRGGQSDFGHLPEGMGPWRDARGLYGPLFFHGQLFQRVGEIGKVSSRAIEAKFDGGRRERLFGSYEPQSLVLGDPILRDCGLHVIQACVPQRRVLPVAVARIAFAGEGTPVRMTAKELWTSGTDYAFDLSFCDSDGRIVEQWHEAVFRDAGPMEIDAVLEAKPDLLDAFLERSARDTCGNDALRCALVSNPSKPRETRRAQALAAIEYDGPLDRRGDGAIIRDKGVNISLAHTSNCSLAVRSDRPVGCDLVSLADFASIEAAGEWAATEALRKIEVIGKVSQADGSTFTTQMGDVARILPVFFVGGAAHLAAIALGSERAT